MERDQIFESETEMKTKQIHHQRGKIYRTRIKLMNTCLLRFRALLSLELADGKIPDGQHLGQINLTIR